MNAKRRRLVFGPNGAAVSAILSQAAALSLDDLCALGRSTNPVSGYLGQQKSWQQARNASERVGQAHSRVTSMSSASDTAKDCVMKAVQGGARENRRNADRIAENWELYRQAASGGDAGKKRKALRRLNRTMIRAIGYNHAKYVTAARRAAANAARVAVVWDLAKDQSEFTSTQRSLLMNPWSSVFAVPEELSQ